jgi:hypothetical protein
MNNNIQNNVTPNYYDNNAALLANNISLQNNNIPTQKNNYNNQETLGDRIKTDLTINGLMGGALGDGAATMAKKQIPQGISFAQKTTQGIKNFSQRFGRGFAGGVITSPQASIAMYAGDKATEKLKEHYLQNDDKASLVHAGIVAAPAALAGTYGFGAMMHGTDNIRHLLKANDQTQRVKALKNLVNPVEHFKRGIQETKDGFKAFNFKNKMSLGSRLFKGFNLLGLGLAAYQGYDYYKKKKAQEKQNKEIANRFNYMQKTAAFPIVTPIADTIKHTMALKKLEHKYGKELARASKEYKDILKERSKAFADIAYDGVGVGLVGLIGRAGYNKAKEKLFGTSNDEQQVRFTY